MRIEYCFCLRCRNYYTCDQRVTKLHEIVCPDYPKKAMVAVGEDETTVDDTSINEWPSFGIPLAIVFLVVLLVSLKIGVLLV